MNFKKRHKDRHREKLGSGRSDAPDERCEQPPLPPSAFIYTACVRKRGEMQVECSWVQLHRQQEQRSCGMLLFSTDYPDQFSMSCFSCKAASLNLASPWLGPCLSAKRPFDRARLMSRPTSTASVSHERIPRKYSNIWKVNNTLLKKMGDQDIGKESKNS
jgi:hypothetical protein